MERAQQNNATQTCPCGSGRSFHDCCEPYLSGEPIPDIETLLRARFSAYATANVNFIRQTWHPATRPARINLDNAESVKWLSLDIVRIERGSVEDQDGSIEFAAHYSVNGEEGDLHEISQFIREQGKWYYMEGSTTTY